jgi:hypothetical protein
VRATRILRPLAAVVPALLALVAAPSAAPSTAHLGLFISGPLADSDGRSFEADRASADILATGGVSRIVVAVDDERAQAHGFDCQPACPAAARRSFTYKRREFGTGTHRVVVRAISGDGRKVTRTITLLPPLPAKAKGAPNPQPAFYITARSPGDLRRQAADDAARFARSQGEGHAQLILDFGAARRHHGEWGVSLRQGTFFTDAQVQSGLQAAARAYHEAYRRGRVTLVYANSNGNLGRPGHGYEPFNRGTAREAGRRQAEVVRGLKLSTHESAAAGGDIEPGYDTVGAPEVSIAMVAAASAGGRPYYDVGTAPCSGSDCTNGWTVEDICAVTTGARRLVLPEIYYVQTIDQPSQWSAVQKACRIEAFAGVSATQGGELKPGESWWVLGRRTEAGVNPSIVVFPR